MVVTYVYIITCFKTSPYHIHTYNTQTWLLITTNWSIHIISWFIIQKHFNYMRLLDTIGRLWGERFGYSNTKHTLKLIRPEKWLHCKDPLVFKRSFEGDSILFEEQVKAEIVHGFIIRLGVFRIVKRNLKPSWVFLFLHHLYFVAGA